MLFRIVDISLVEVALVLPCSEAARRLEIMRWNYGASNIHSTLRGNIKSKKTTTNNGNGRDSVNVPNRHLYGTCLVVHSWANCTERGL